MRPLTWTNIPSKPIPSENTFYSGLCVNMALLSALVAKPPGGRCRAHGRRSCPLRRRARRPLSFVGSLPPLAGPPRVFSYSFWAPRCGRIRCNTPPRRPPMPVIMGMLKNPRTICRELRADMCKRGWAGPGRPERRVSALCGRAGIVGECALCACGHYACVPCACARCL